MKKFRSEFTHSSETYSFGYTNYLKKEPNDAFSEIYASGYLPYSGATDIKNIFYMSRSARIPLKNFKLNSENRRIVKKFNGLFTKRSIPVKNLICDKSFLFFCVNYFEKRHGQRVMPKKRLLYILEMGFLTSVVEYKNKDKIVGYVFLVEDANMRHYWYSFYDLVYVYKSLGMWLMIDAAQDAKSDGKDYFYLGTVYSEKALYKTNFDGLEYWNGNEWILDKKNLRAKSKKDKNINTNTIDEWKENLNLF